MSQNDETIRELPPFSRPASVQPGHPASPEAEIAREQAASAEEKVVETPVQARQGFLGKPVAMVLGVSLILVLVAWIALYAV